MKQALIFGGGSKWGKSFTRELLRRGYSIDLVTSNPLSDVNNIIVDWNNLNQDDIKRLIDRDKNYDLIFFNHNNGGIPNDHFLKPGNEIDLNSWNYNAWIGYQLPYSVIQHLSKTINENTKIGFMLTGMIVSSQREMFQYAGYATTKSALLHLLRGFSCYFPGTFFGINPDWFPEDLYDNDALLIADTIERLTKEDSGKTFKKDGSFWI